jgi:acetyl esterase/lipase
MRASWEKSTHPLFRLITYFNRGYLPIRRDIEIERPEKPSPSSFSCPLPPVKARLYFPGTEEELARASQIILDIPGGGFVAMTPKHHDDYLSQWARNLNVPVVSLNYGKAPEKPFPWAIEECFDAYRSIVESNGKCIGLEGKYSIDQKGVKTEKDPIKVVLVGDSA